MRSSSVRRIVNQAEMIYNLPLIADAVEERLHALVTAVDCRVKAELADLEQNGLQRLQSPETGLAQ